MHPAGEVFVVALRLGISSFGGPLVHIARFRQEYVDRRRWIDEAAFARLLAVCQLLPGPTSSQVGVAIGRHRAGLLGALAAWVGFTLPSALAMAAAAIGWPWMPPASQGLLGGLTAGAFAVVAVAALTMARTLTSTWYRGLIALGAGLMSWMIPGLATPLVVLALAAVAGRLDPRPPVPPAPPAPGPPLRTWPWFLVLGVLVVAVASLSELSPLGFLAAAFFQAGILVFGGGHVVLPLLHSDLVASGGLDPEQVMAGYGLAQLLPGPLFSVAVLWGWQWAGPFGGLVALGALFLPGLLLVLAMAPWADRWMGHPGGAAAFAGVSAAMVGLLGAALVSPLGLHRSSRPLLALLAGCLTLAHGVGRLPAVVVVLGGAATGWAIGLL